MSESMSQRSRTTIVQADVILQVQKIGSSQSQLSSKGTNITKAQQTSSEKNHQKEQEYNDGQKIEDLQNSYYQIQQNERKRERERERERDVDSITQIKVKSQRQNQIMKKIKAVKQKIIKSEQKFLDNEQRQSKIQLIYRKKKLPELIKSQQSSDVEEQDQEGVSKNKKVAINYKDQVIANFRKNKYRRKNYNFQNKITKLSDIKLSQKSINIKGQIIFIWQKQLINQKWAKTQMICLQLYDETGTVMIAIPQKCMTTNNWEFDIGKYVQMQRVSVRQKYPQRICILVHQKSKLKITKKSQVPKQLLSQPEKLGITIKQIEAQQVGRVCNLVCLVLQKTQNQFFRSGKGHDLTVSKLVVYDPIDNKSIVVKLWQEKAQLKFYTNAVIYLLRGIQIKDFKGVREYHATKDFNLRSLTFSHIEESLQLLFQERWRKLRYIPSKIEVLSINQCSKILRLEVKKRKKIDVQKKEQESNPESKKIMQMSEKVAGKEQQQKENEMPKSKVLVLWSVCEVRIVGIQIKSNYPIKFSQCIRCISKTMIDCFGNSRCSVCDSQKSKSVYWIKCEFYDGGQNYLGQISERAAGKMFSAEDVPMKLQFFESTNLNFKKQIEKELIGDAVRAIIATTKQEIGENTWVTGHYIMDILPFDDQISQESNKLDSDGGNQSVSKIISLIR